MENLHALAYAVLTYRRLEGQEHDEECFANVMEALINTIPVEEAVKKAFKKGDKNA